MKTCCIVALVLSIAIPAPSFAQATEGRLARSAMVRSPSNLIISERAVAAAIAEHPPAQPSRRRDSVANGALIGGFLAAAVMAGGGAYLCNELKEPGETSSCWPGVLTVGAISFAAGAAIGAGIDALFARSRPAQPFSGT